MSNFQHYPACNDKCVNGAHYLIGDNASITDEPLGRIHIPDPTVKTNLPKNLLAALGNAHINLQFQVNKLAHLLDDVGWPEGESIHDFEVISPPLSNALDYARENARLTWVICGMTDSLSQVLGEMQFNEDGSLHTMGVEVVPPVDMSGRRGWTTYDVDRTWPAPPPGAPNGPVIEPPTPSPSREERA